MTSSTKSLYAGHRFPAELISYTVWLYFRFPLSLRMVEEMLAFRGIEVSHETIRQWGLKFGQEFANIIRRRLPRPGDKWHLDEVYSDRLKTRKQSDGDGRLDPSRFLFRLAFLSWPLGPPVRRIAFVFARFLNFRVLKWTEYTC